MIQYQNEIIEGKYYFLIEMGKSHILRKEVLGHLQKHRPGWTETCSVEDCNVILVFCPIVSRAGTDINAALNKLNTCPASKPAIFMVLHHTFDTEKIVPDSSRFIIRRNTLTVDCLFHEDKGLLKCKMNEEALTKVVCHFKPQEQKTFHRLIIKTIFTADHAARIDISGDSCTLRISPGRSGSGLEVLGAADEASDAPLIAAAASAALSATTGGAAASVSTA
ncbi:hypothetical protein G5714_005643 [Onychostoma macrolepis]|uniref:Uncharacterized protein n=1 Tax=Onychostoma macrolepis TaxID=369639 RepID=A0A7J6D1K2_9TELE|nr:hypothetical protein G5714_005643 [Onychostoma macrolepis]